MNVSPRFSTVIVIVVLASSHLLGGTLQWGADGQGGSGNWDSATANWWNGTSATTWSDGIAVFDGTAGTVNLSQSLSPRPTVDSLTFNVSGYNLSGGWIDGGASGLTITTNGDATVGSTLSSRGSAALAQTLVKQGAAALTLTGINFLNHVVVSAGELRSEGTNSLFFSQVTLADAAGAIVTLGQTAAYANIEGLNGGGSQGGMVRPGEQARTVNLTIWGTDRADIFAGTLADNGAGVLAVEIFGGTQSQTLTGVNTYSGATRVTAGTLILAANGTVANTSDIAIKGQGTLRLDNTTAPVDNRLTDTTPITLREGTLEMIGNGSFATTENLGQLIAGASAHISVQQTNSQTATLHFSGLTRLDHGMIQVSGNGSLAIDGLANNAGGILGGYARFGEHWATVAAGGIIQAFADYKTDLTTASATDNVLIAGTDGNVSLNTSRSWNSLKLHNEGSGEAKLNLGGYQTLTLDSGGLLTTGTGSHYITAGSLTAGSSHELIITNQTDLTIRSFLVEGSGKTDFVKAGTGTLTLMGTGNTYTGNTYVNEGTLVISADSALGAGDTVYLNSGTLRASHDFSTGKAVGASSGYTALVDTGSYQVTFETASFGSLSKRGAGTLNLAGGATGPLAVNQGTLVLAHGSYGRVFIQSGGTLTASGTISYLGINISDTYRSGGTSGNVGDSVFMHGDEILDLGDASSSELPILDIGGDSAATLTVEQFSFSGNSFQLRFGLGSTANDLLIMSAPFGREMNIAFDFHDLGGLQTGAVYTLIEFSDMFSSIGYGLQSSLSDDLIAAGWLADFHLVAGDLTVTFSAIPEPRIVAALAGFATLASALIRRRIQHRPRS